HTIRGGVKMRKPCFALPQNTTAFGVAFNDNFPQVSTANMPLILPESATNPEAPNIPILYHVINTGTGLRVERSGTYYISYSVTVSLPLPSSTVRFFAVLNNNPLNIIGGSGTAGRTDSVGTGGIIVLTNDTLTNLYSGDSVQIIPQNP
ncbi:hypothetical protein CN488_29425, partial [Bacillus anthracis]